MEQVSKVKNKLTKELKNAKTYSDLMSLKKELYENNLILRSKKRKLRAFSFLHMYKGQHTTISGMTDDEVEVLFKDKKYKNRVSYLFDDGVSKGESYVENLHRNLEVCG